MRPPVETEALFSAHGLHRIHREICRMSEELLRLLGGLGATPQDIAAKLGAEGIRGQRRSPSFQNPIVRYLCRHRQVGGLIYVPVHDDLLTVVRQGKCDTVQLPQAVSHFLNAFHAGDFPQLEER
jgi:hypothetical protein